MYQREFLRKVISSDGYCCLFAVNPKTAGGPKQTFHLSADELIQRAEELDAKGYNVYFGTGTFKDTSSRLATNVQLMKSFFLDLDCGPTKEFDDKKHALTELKKFCKTNKLPKPTLIDSGNGIHVYWPLKEAVSRDDWKPVADRLKALCAEQNFEADPSVTADAARILRIPQTNNYKTTPPKPVRPLNRTEDIPEYDFEDFVTLLGAEAIRIPSLASELFEQTSSMMQHLMGNKESSFRDIITKGLSGCAQLTNIVKNRESLSEPIWRAGLSIAVRCIDADKAIHNISKGYPEYSFETAKDKANETEGPYKCETFESLDPEKCKGCPHKGKITSPIQLGSRVARTEPEEIKVVSTAQLSAPVATLHKKYQKIIRARSCDDLGKPTRDFRVPHYPKPHFRGKNGGVYTTIEDEDGNKLDRLVYEHDFYATCRTYDEDLGESINVELHMPMDGVRSFNIPLSCVAKQEEFKKLLCSKGAFSMNMKGLIEYMADWIKKLQFEEEAEMTHKQFGWVGKGFDEFILGANKITKDGAITVPPSENTREKAPYLQPHGSLFDWQEAMAIWEEEKFAPQQYAVGMGFGSILMGFGDIHSSALHLYSKESGVGKTAILRAMASIWGNPQKLISGKVDTDNYKMNDMETLHSLPALVDEITNLDPDRASELLYQITSGQQKGRMSGTSNAPRRRGEAWSLLFASTGNTSILDRIGLGKSSPKAEAQRVLEYRVRRMFNGHKTKALTDKFSVAIDNNYGFAGAMFVEYVIKNQATVRQVISKLGEVVDEKAKLSSENRFWSAQVKCACAGLFLAEKAGILNYDYRVAMKWAINDLIPFNKTLTRSMDMSTLDVMSKFFSENYTKILRIHSTRDKRAGEEEEVAAPEAIVQGKLVARYEFDVKLFYIMPDALKRFCGFNQIDFKTLEADLIEHHEGGRVRYRMTKGTNVGLPQCRVLRIKFNEGDATASDDETSDA